jgi:hypothetical protein
MNIHFIILNMNKNKDRLEKIKIRLKNMGVSYTRIEAIDGFKLQKNKDVLQMLECRSYLLNKTLYCKTFNQEWKYIGNIQTSFPGLNLYGHDGAKGLILSNIKAFKECLKINDEYIYALNDDNKINLQDYKSQYKKYSNKYKWFCVLEDDAIINNEIYTDIQKFINKDENKDAEVILLDKRVAGGAAGVIYNSKIIKKLIEDLHPLSEFSITMEEKFNHATLWDWKLWHYVTNMNINYKLFPCIDSGQFISTINI